MNGELSGPDIVRLHGWIREQMNLDAEDEDEDRALRMASAAVSAAGQETPDGVPLYVDPFHRAGKLMDELIARHPFREGTDRTALAAALVALEIQGLRVRDTSPRLLRLIERLRSAKGGPEDAAEVLRGLYTLSAGG